MKLKIGFNLFLLIPLILIKEGHVSSGISRISFEQLVNRSDAIMLVSKNTPYDIPFKAKYSDSSNEEFETSLYSFRIKSIVSDPRNLMKGKSTIEIHSDTDLGNMTDMQMEFENRGRRIRIHHRYESKSENVDQEKEFLIFITFNELVGWFSFAAGGAMESKQLMDSVRVLISNQSSRPFR